MNKDGKLGLLDIDLEDASGKVQQFIRKYVVELKKDGALVGLSGGIDSCIVLKLCSDALGKDNVLAVILPERDSDNTNMRDAVRFAKELGIKYIYKKITPVLWMMGVYNLYPPSFLFRRSTVEKFVKKERNKISGILKKDAYLATLEGGSNKQLCKGEAFYRVKHRLRSAILFYYSELNNLLYVGTSNKSEWMTGYFVKYGDNIADIMPVISFYKTQIFNLARYLNLPSYVIEKSPSPDLIPGIIDEDMLGVSYEKLDLILFGIENNYSLDKIMSISNAEEADESRVKEIVEKSEYLRKWPIALQ